MTKHTISTKFIWTIACLVLVAALILLALHARVPDQAAQACVTGKDASTKTTKSSSTADLVLPAADTARAMRRFHLALSTVAESPVDILVGPTDSIGDGMCASSASKRFAAILRDQLRERFQPEGVPGGYGYSDFWNQGEFPDSPVAPVDPVVNQTFGLGLQSLVMTVKPQTITISDTFTTAKIAYRTAPGAGYLFYAVDGGTPVSVDASGAAGEATETIGPLAVGKHKIVLYGGFTPDPVIYEGVLLLNGDERAGIRVWEAGQSGYSAANYVAEPRWAEAVDRVQPALVVLPIGSNDFAAGRTPAATRADILRIIASIRAHATVDPSIVLVSYFDRPHSGSETWDSFVAMYREIAARDDAVCLLDMSPVFGPYGAATRDGLLSGDGVHLSDAGHRAIGSALVTMVSP